MVKFILFMVWAIVSFGIFIEIIGGRRKLINKLEDTLNDGRYLLSIRKSFKSLIITSYRLTEIEKLFTEHEYKIIEKECSSYNKKNIRLMILFYLVPIIIFVILNILLK